MKNLVNYVGSLLNIKIDNPLIIEDMKQELLKVKNLVTYREYIRDNLNHVDMEFKTGFQKFIVLTNKYLKQQQDLALPHDTARSFSKQLSHKVKQTRNIVEEKNIVFSMLRIDGEKFFTEKELKALQGIGSIVYIIESSRNGTLENELVDLFLGKYISKSKYTSLTSNQKRVSALIGEMK